jgi:hypothetical protein
MVGDMKIAVPLSKEFDRSRMVKHEGLPGPSQPESKLPAGNVGGERRRMSDVIVERLDQKAYQVIAPIVSSLLPRFTPPLWTGVPLVMPKLKGTGYNTCLNLLAESLSEINEATVGKKSGLFRNAKMKLIDGYKKDSRLNGPRESGYTTEKLYALCFPDSEYTN